MLQFGPKTEGVAPINMQQLWDLQLAVNPLQGDSATWDEIYWLQQLIYTGGHVSTITKPNIEILCCNLVQTLSKNYQ